MGIYTHIIEHANPRDRPRPVRSHRASACGDRGRHVLLCRPCRSLAADHDRPRRTFAGGAQTLNAKVRARPSSWLPQRLEHAQLSHHSTRRGTHHGYRKRPSGSKDCSRGQSPPSGQSSQRTRRKPTDRQRRACACSRADCLAPWWRVCGRASADLLREFQQRGAGHRGKTSRCLLRRLPVPRRRDLGSSSPALRYARQSPSELSWRHRQCRAGSSLDRFRRQCPF
jgi:hypothetical protein